MSRLVSRAQFLRGDLQGRNRSIRPPWALVEDAFIDACSRCDQCLDACPEKIIRKGRGGFPEIDFSQGECTFCAACVDRCPDKALLKGASSDMPWQLSAHVDDQCLALQGVVCMTCKEQCDARAIAMLHRPGAVAIPHINNELCTGCGACYQPCPSHSIVLTNESLFIESPEGTEP